MANGKLTEDEVANMPFMSLLNLLDEKEVDYGDIEDEGLLRELVMIEVFEKQRTSSLRYRMANGKLTEDEVANMPYMCLLDLLDEMEVDYEGIEDEGLLRELVMIEVFEKQRTSTLRYTTCDWQGFLTKDVDQRQQLKEVYDSICNLIDRFRQKREGIFDELELKFKFDNCLKNYKESLDVNDCPIVIAGETSAGKSTILNLMLGEDLLPVESLSTTSTICRIRNSATKGLKVYMKGKEKPTVFKDLSQNELKERLQQYGHVEKERDDNPYEKIDVLWPIPNLQHVEHVYLVDTPGIGESEDMTRRLMEYLPNAAAFIFVINSSNAGGLQKDRILRIFTELLEKAGDRRNMDTMFDPQNTIFLCNKWDTINEKEKEKVWKRTLDELDKCWPILEKEDLKDTEKGNEVDKRHVFKIEALKERERTKHQQLGHSETFKEFWKCLQQMIPKTLESRRKFHIKWTHEFLKEILRRVSISLGNCRKSETEKQRMFQEVEMRLDNLVHLNKEIQKDLQERLTKLENKLCQDLGCHLKRTETKERIFSTESLPLPSTLLTMEEIEYEAKWKIREIICKEVQSWCQHGDGSKAIHEFKTYAKEKLGIVYDKIQELEQAFNDDVGSEDNAIEMDDTFNVSVKEKIVAAVFSPLWVPVLIAGAAVAVLFAAPIGLGFALKEKIKKEMFKNNPSKYLKKWAEEQLGNLTCTDLKLREIFMGNSCMGTYSKSLDELFETTIPDRIKAEYVMINNLRQDLNNESSMGKLYKPLEFETRCVLGKLYLAVDEILGLQIKQSDLLIQENTIIGKGAFATVYRGTYKGNNVAVKMMHTDIEADCFGVFEAENMKMLRNAPNIAYFFGISIHDDNGVQKIALVTELCDTSLDVVLSERAKQGKLCSNSERDDESFKFYKETCTGISKGLLYMHKKGIVHRDLKPANILMKGGVPKLCDVGVSKDEMSITGTIAGTPVYMAPEVLGGKVHTRAADIYSFAVTLWEIWYGKMPYKTLPRTASFQEKLEEGMRLPFDEMSPCNELKALIKESWDTDPRRRPDASGVCEVLEKIQPTAL